MKIDFNLFKPVFDASKFKDFVFKKRNTATDKNLRKELGRLWRDGSILAYFSGKAISYHSSSDSEWIVVRKKQKEILVERAFVEQPFEKVPASVILTAMAAMVIDGFVFEGPSRRYWGKRSSTFKSMTCVSPTFTDWDGYVAIDATVSKFGKASSQTKAETFKENGSSFRSDGYRLATVGDTIRISNKNFRASMAWIGGKNGKFEYKTAFLEWFVSELENTGMVKMNHVSLSPSNLKSMIGDAGAKKHLAKDKTVLSINGMKIDVELYNRTTISWEDSWSRIVSRVEDGMRALGLNVNVLDVGRSESDSANYALVAIDAKDDFEEDEEDTKPQAVSGFSKPVQCFTSKVMGDDKALESAILIMMANLIMKYEIQNGKLMVERIWLNEWTSKKMFCEERIRKEGSEILCEILCLNVKLNGDISFKIFKTECEAEDYAKDVGLSPIFKDPDEKMDLNSTSIRITDSPLKVLPLIDRAGMTSHFTGIQIVEDLNCYFSGSMSRPNGKSSVKKALIAREVKCGDGVSVSDLTGVAATCVDPLVKIASGLAWPAPFKLLAEFSKI